MLDVLHIVEPWFLFAVLCLISSLLISLLAGGIEVTLLLIKGLQKKLNPDFYKIFLKNWGIILGVRFGMSFFILLFIYLIFSFVVGFPLSTEMTGNTLVGSLLIYFLLLPFTIRLVVNSCQKNNANLYLKKWIIYVHSFFLMVASVFLFFEGLGSIPV